MTRDNEFNLHANVNRHGNDVVLRVTITWYDEQGIAAEPKTWRGHTTLPWFTDNEHQAIVALDALSNLVRRAAHLEPISELDVPLF